jgi:hypothetical protein
VTFDGQGRLAGINATLDPDPPEPRRRRFWRR